MVDWNGDKFHFDIGMQMKTVLTLLALMVLAMQVWAQAHDADSLAAVATALGTMCDDGNGHIFNPDADGMCRVAHITSNGAGWKFSGCVYPKEFADKAHMPVCIVKDVETHWYDRFLGR